MGAVKQAMIRQQEAADAAVPQMLARAIVALSAIEDIHPSNFDEPVNEWTEADCYHRARKIARLALRSIREAGYGSV